MQHFRIGLIIASRDVTFAKPGATEVLVRVLKDPAEHPMVRHEAAEALGSVAESDDQVMGLLREYCKDEVQCVGQSCVVALDMLETKENFEYCEALA